MMVWNPIVDMPGEEESDSSIPSGSPTGGDDPFPYNEPEELPVVDEDPAEDDPFPYNEIDELPDPDSPVAADPTEGDDQDTGMIPDLGGIDDLFGGGNDQEDSGSSEETEPMTKTIRIKYNRSLTGGVLSLPKTYRIQVSGRIKPLPSAETGFLGNDKVQEDSVKGTIRVAQVDEYKFSGEVEDVEVYGNAGSVEVFIDGEKHEGVKTEKSRLLSPTNVAVGVGILGVTGYFLNSVGANAVVEKVSGE